MKLYDLNHLGLEDANQNHWPAILATGLAAVIEREGPFALTTSPLFGVQFLSIQRRAIHLVQQQYGASVTQKKIKEGTGPDGYIWICFLKHTRDAYRRTIYRRVNPSFHDVYIIDIDPQTRQIIALSHDGPVALRRDLARARASLSRAIAEGW